MSKDFGSAKQGQFSTWIIKGTKGPCEIALEYHN